MSTDAPPLPSTASERPEHIGETRPVPLGDLIDAAMDLSGATLVGDFLILGADEGHNLQILRRDPQTQAWTLHRTLAVAKRDQEADIEAITYGDGQLYAIGSHSFRRRRMKPENPLRKNRERLLMVEAQESRNRLVRIPFDPDSGEVGEAERIDLSKRLRKDPVLGTFFGVPSKENGIDIEGMAFRDGELFLGFRGPVLRDNHVPVMVLTFERPKRYALRFVRLDGQGIRDMTAVDDGFLILSGPVNDAPGPFCLWWWDGLDQIPGRDHQVRPTTLLGAISTPGGAKAEGLALLSQHGSRLEVLVVYDTTTANQAVSMQVLLPD